MDEMIGIVKIFAGNYAPRGWAFCRGQLLPIGQYKTLYSILGTTYGGDGRTTFALPDLRGRSPISAGNGPGLDPHALGSRGGVERVVLDTAELPAHITTNRVAIESSSGHTSTFNGNFPAHENRPPFLTLNYIICLEGTFPART